MMARIQRLVALALLTLALVWAVYFSRIGSPGWAGAGALTILLGYALFLGIEFMVLYFFGQSAEPALRPSITQLIGAWCGEIIAAPRIFMWRQPFRSNAEPDSLSGAETRGHTGVILVHGFVCNRGFWNPWMRELRLQHVPFIAVNLEPVFGSIDECTRIIELAVTRIEATTAMPVVLVGHSMGGLAIRAWLAHFSADARVRRVITVGSPHHGTWLARFGHTVNGAQMRTDSPWLKRLGMQELASRRARFTCFFGHCDNIVFPTASATLPDAENIHLPGTAHVQMAFKPEVFNEVRRWLGPVVDPALAPQDPPMLRG